MSITIYTRQGCPLCDEGIARVREVFGEDVSLVDIDLDLALLERFDERVPVVVDGDGTVIDEGLIDGSVLRAYARKHA